MLDALDEYFGGTIPDPVRRAGPMYVAISPFGPPHSMPSSLTLSELISTICHRPLAWAAASVSAGGLQRDAN